MKSFGENMNERTCIVTRQPMDADALIRFVSDPEGNIVADLKCNLPGRGCWVTADRKHIDLAVSRKLFSKSLQTKVTTSDQLGQEIDKLLVKALMGMMGLAKKAGQLVSGSTKVEAAVRSGEAIAVFHAIDGAEDGIRKIDQARHSTHIIMEGPNIFSYRLLDAANIGFALGVENVIHAAALAGQAGEGVMKRAKTLDNYRKCEISTEAQL